MEECINFAGLPGWVGCEVWDEEVQSQADCEYSHSASQVISDSRLSSLNSI